jgi:hypothetical protein
MIGFKHTVRVFICSVFINTICLGSLFAQAQQGQSQAQVQQLPVQLQPPHPKDKIVQRETIDAKRMGEDVNGEDALPRSREFIRTDSTYYVGWLFEGTYKYNHAADYVGFKNASVPLERARTLLERDYRKALATRTDNVLVYFPVYKFQIDYTMIAYYLMNCYSNMEEPDKVYTLLRRVLKWNFQRDYYMDAYNYLGWTVHRNRFYTSGKYSFLKNSIDDNERLANKYLDMGLRKIEHDKPLNAHIFPPGYEVNDIMGVYFYKTILYSYQLKIDSAGYYYNLIRNSPVFSHNNFGTFRSICGDFRDAESEYKLASAQDPGDKRLHEWAYYSSILNIYKALPKSGVQQMKDMILANGSTPGFGWYNIGLARCMLYDGQIDEANRYINKAADFKELHIGTTLGQTHYDFSIQLVKLMNKQAEWQQQQFENRNWWYNPQVLGNMAQLMGQKYLQQFLIINQFAQNPERDRVIYKLFSTESTVTWDEVWYLIRDFSTQFFLDRFRHEAQTDNRRYIHKYFELFVARLEMKQGKYADAGIILDGLLREQNTDVQYEKLFVARLYQAEAECAKERNDYEAYNDWVYRMYLTFPQLLPYTGLQGNVSLHIIGQADTRVVERLKACNINWVTNSSIPAPQAYISFTRNGNKKDIQYYVIDKTGERIVEKQSFAYQKPEDAGTSLAYRLFNIGGKMPPADTDNGK